MLVFRKAPEASQKLVNILKRVVRILLRERRGVGALSPAKTGSDAAENSLEKWDVTSTMTSAIGMTLLAQHPTSSHIHSSLQRQDYSQESLANLAAPETLNPLEHPTQLLHGALQPFLPQIGHLIMADLFR